MTENIYAFQLCPSDGSTQTGGEIQQPGQPKCIDPRTQTGSVAKVIRERGGGNRRPSWRQSRWVFVVVLALCSTAFGQNIVQNPGFELGNAPWHCHDNWGVFATTTNFPHSGSAAGMCSYRTQTWGGPEQSLLGRLQPGVPYFCSAWVRVENGNAEPVKMTFRWKDASSSDHYTAFPATTADSESWTLLTNVFSFIPVGTLTELVIYFEGPATVVNLLVDDVLVAPIRPPVVELKFPINGTRLASGTNLVLDATPTVSDGLKASSVEYYQSGLLLGRLTNAPYSLLWSNVPAGTYFLTAKVTDSLGQSSVSASASVVVVSDKTPLTFFPEFSLTNGLWLQGDSLITSNRLRLTSARNNRLGAVWLSARQMVQNGFQATFQFQITATNSWGGEGLAFVIQDHDFPLLGGSGAGLGYEGLSNSLAIEFDLRQNRVNADPNGKHISVHCLGTEPNTAFEGISLGWTDDIPDLSDGKIHTATIRYEPGKLTVFLDNPVSPVLSLGLDLENALKLDQGKAWVGFTASTSEGYENHDLLMFSFWPDVGPSIRLSQPLDQEVFLAPATIPIFAEASDNDSLWVWVDFYANDFYLGSAISPSFGLTWTNVQAGQYQLRAEAIDEFGTTSDSIPVNVTVEQPPRITRIWEVSGEGWSLKLNTVLGRSYTVYRSADLTNWEAADALVGAGGPQQWKDPEPSGRARFYRVVLQP